MIKFTMGSCDNKKTHRRKPKRTSKTCSAALPIGHQTSNGGGICGVPTPLNHAISGPALRIGGAGCPSVVSPVCVANAVASTNATTSASSVSDTNTATAYRQVKYPSFICLQASKLLFDRREAA
jgi:hypothetical protein